MKIQIDRREKLEFEEQEVPVKYHIVVYVRRHALRNRVRVDEDNTQARREASSDVRKSAIKKSSAVIAIYDQVGCQIKCLLAHSHLAIPCPHSFSLLLNGRTFFNRLLKPFSSAASSVLSCSFTCVT